MNGAYSAKTCPKSKLSQFKALIRLLGRAPAHPTKNYTTATKFRSQHTRSPLQMSMYRVRGTETNTHTQIPLTHTLPDNLIVFSSGYSTYTFNITISICINRRMTNASRNCTIVYMYRTICAFFRSVGVLQLLRMEGQLRFQAFPKNPSRYTVRTN